MKELLARLSARPGLALELGAASFFANMLALATPLFVIQVLNRYVAHGVDSTLATLSAGAVAAVMLEIAFRQVRARLAQAVNAGPDEALATAGFDVLTRGRVAALERIPPGTRREVVEGAANVENAFSATNVGVVLDVPFALLFLGVIFLLNPILGLVVAVFLAGVFAAGTMAAARLRRPTRDLMNASGRAGALVGTAIAAADMVRAFNAAGFLDRAWANCVNRSQALRRRIVAQQGLVQTLNQGAAALMSIAVVAIGGILVVQGNFDVGAMIGANILAARALMPVSRFAQLGEVFAKARQSAEFLRAFADLPVETSRGSAPGAFKGAIAFRDVAFAHPGSTGPLFESLTINLQPGAILMVTGANGTGKTTLARMLANVIEPLRGQILVDGIDLRQVVPEWWRRQIVYLPQEPALLDASIGENIRIANPGMDDDELGRVIDVAGLGRFIDESPGGLDEPITDNGRRLSRGIRRRVALARALATDGMLAVFDEPTEGLDAEGSAAVLRAMNDLVARGRTIIVMSHDPNLIKGASGVLDLNAKPVPRVAATPRAVDAADGPGKAAAAIHKEKVPV